MGSGAACRHTDALVQKNSVKETGFTLQSTVQKPPVNNWIILLLHQHYFYMMLLSNELHSGQKIQSLTLRLQLIF